MKKALSGLVFLLLGAGQVFASDNNPKSIHEQCLDEAYKIKYVLDGFYDENNQYVDLDIWQTPFITKLFGTGDCEDLSFYLYYLLQKKGLKARVVYGHVEFEEINGYHIWIE